LATGRNTEGKSIVASSLPNAECSRPPVSVFLLIDSRVLRESLARLFRKRADLRVVGQGQYSDQAVTEIAESQCDVLLLDDANVLDSSEDIIRHILANSPQTGIILFGMEEDPSTFLKAAQSGITGYLLKEASLADIIAAVRGVAQGEGICPPRMCLALFQHVASESRLTGRLSDELLARKLGLTRRQQQLVSLVAMGLTNKEIASHLNLSEFTIKNHIHRLMKQVDAENRSQAVENIRASGLTLVS
jgi:DNA-binding NarL/FixJ family response regulator